MRTKDVVLNDTTAASDLEKNNLNPSSPSQNSLLGKFKLKQERNDTSDVSIGSFFAKRNDVKDETPSTGNFHEFYQYFKFYEIFVWWMIFF